jgi:hypothetical protein
VREKDGKKKNTWQAADKGGAFLPRVSLASNRGRTQGCGWAGLRVFLSILREVEGC